MSNNPGRSRPDNPIYLALLLILLLCMTRLEAEERLDGGVNPGYHEPPSWFKQSFLDLPDDLAEARANDRRVLLYFYQDGCPYCGKLLTEGFGDPSIAAYTQAHFDTLALNLWGDREVTDLQGETTTEKPFAATLRVQYTPTLVVLDSRGQVTLRLNGYYPPERLHLALAFAAGDGVTPDETLAAYIDRHQAAQATTTPLEDPRLLTPPYLLDRTQVAAQHPLLVLFETDHCPQCTEFQRDVWPREELQPLLDRFDLVRLGRDAETRLITPDGQKLTAKAWAAQLGIDYTPAVVMFDEQGQEAFRISAYLRPFHYAAALRYVVDGAWREQPNFQRYIEGLADAMRERGEVVDLWR